MGEQFASQISVLTGSALIFGITVFFIRWIAAKKRIQLLGIGVMWVVLTVLFEIVLGRYVLNLSWDRIAEDHDLTRGGFLGLGLMVMDFSPFLAAKLRRVCDDSTESAPQMKAPN